MYKWFLFFGPSRGVHSSGEALLGVVVLIVVVAVVVVLVV